ncbi:hypothetical protein [Micromonospora rubida]
MALVELSIVEQRYPAGLSVQAGDPVVEVAAWVGVVGSAARVAHSLEEQLDT